MISRYKVKEVADVWSTDNKLETWLKVEMAHLESMLTDVINPTISTKELEDIKGNINIDIARWKEIEEETRHDLQAYVQMLEESIPNNSGRWIHYGLTSSDIIDTSLVLLCKESLNIVKKYCADLIFHMNKALKSDEAYANILSRTHGKAAEVQTYRHVIQRWLSQLRRGYDSIILAEKSMKYGKLSGPSGNNNTNSVQCENIALSILDLHSTRCSQIIPRDVFLDYFFSMLKIILAVEKIAYDIRVYSIDGVNEFSEPFRKGQKGSSSMPHKKNPILSENICGLSRLYKSYVNIAIENCLTLLERDISHSAPERIIFEDAAHITCFTLQRCATVIKGMNLNIECAQENINKFKKSIESQSIMNENIFNGESRKNSHDVSQNSG
jgi:adenylosuccinate lyase